MKAVLLSILALAGTAAAGNMEQCQKNCGIEFGKCMITKFDLKQCMQEEAGCALDCLKSVTLSQHSHHQYGNLTTKEAHHKYSPCEKECKHSLEMCLKQRKTVDKCM